MSRRDIIALTVGPQGDDDKRLWRFRPSGRPLPVRIEDLPPEARAAFAERTAKTVTSFSGERGVGYSRGPTSGPVAGPLCPGMGVTVSAGTEAGAVPPWDEAVVFEPREDRPAGADPWIAAQVSAGARQIRSLMLWSLPLVACCVHVLATGRAWSGFALPAVLALFFAVRFVWGLYRWHHSRPRSLKRLLAMPPRKISLGESGLLATKRALYVRLSGDQWFRLMPSSVYAPLLARRRHVRVLGPDSSGRAIVFLPGMAQGVARRVEQAPPSEAGPVAGVAMRAPAPKDDPMVRAAVRFTGRYVLASAVPTLLAAGWLAATYGPRLSGPDYTMHDLPGIASLFGVSLAVLLLWTSVVAVSRLRILTRAAHAPTWTPLRITLDSPRQREALFPSAKGRCTLPDDTLRPVELRRTSASLVAAVEASGVLWVAGEPRKGGNTVGVPGFPILGVAKLGSARKP